MTSPGERLFTVFESRLSNSDYHQLSGWDPPAYNPLTAPITLQLLPSELGRYYFEGDGPNSGLSDAKTRIARHLAEREQRVVPPDTLVLVPGASAALSLAVLFMQRNGCEALLLDPPFYFSVRRLATALTMTLVVVSRNTDGLHTLAPLLQSIKASSKMRKCVILTQPRYVLSVEYRAADLQGILSLLEPTDHLLLDQSVDLSWPSCLPDDLVDPRVIRIRTFGKGVSLNGSRLAAVIASADIASELATIAQWLYGGLDVASLKLGLALVTDSCVFAAWLRGTREVVAEAVRRSKAILNDRHAQIIAPTNGFLGYALLDLRHIGRYRFVNALLRQRVHAMFGPHFGLASHFGRDLLRINFLLDIDTALRTVNYCLKDLD